MEIILSVILGITVIVVIALTITTIFLTIKLKEYKKKSQKIWKNFDNENIEQDINKLLERLQEVEKNSNETKIISEATDGKMIKCIQKIGMVKYDAYNSGNKGLSFSLALLDNENTGVLLNSIYTREGSNIYAKEISKGEYDGELTDEENEALNKALKRKSFM